MQRNVVNATIEDTGNLVLYNTTNAVVWQSFDSPTDTLLPNQTFDTSKTLTAWNSARDWSKGNYTLGWPSNDYILGANWHVPYPWVTPVINYWRSNETLSQAFVTPGGEIRVVTEAGIESSLIPAPQFDVPNPLVRVTMDQDGNLVMYSMYPGNSTWTVEWKAWGEIAIKECQLPGFCGPYSICNQGYCTCPPGFEFVDVTDKRFGCQRIEPAAYCNANASADTFIIDDNASWLLNDLPNSPQNVTLDNCLQQCLARCDCQAVVISQVPYSATDLIDTCWHKRDSLLDGNVSAGARTYLRVGAGSLQPPSGDHNILKIAVGILSGAVLLLSSLCCAFGSVLVARKMQKLRQKKIFFALQHKWVAAKGAMVRFTYREIKLMTTNFETKIGEGGYGTVFKGQVGNEHLSSSSITTVAVKRLNKLSTNVEQEFLNEVETLGLIHHVHLVALLGYCTDAGHRLLVYEYVEKGSLDKFLFPQRKLSVDVLDWRKRFTIAIQTAGALAYLHDDCRHRITHCDIKPENILLDASYCVKVADFGLSRIKNRNHIKQTITKTINIRGTLGYIAPECFLFEGVSISNKMDVFSYGMVLLEIISGRRNVLRGTPTGMSFRADAPYFPAWAYPLIGTELFLEVVDPAIVEFVDPKEVKRALQVAYWCINEKPHVRPAMSEVVQMLQGHVAIELPVPQPTFFDTLGLRDLEGSQSSRRVSSEFEILSSDEPICPA